MERESARRLIAEAICRRGIGHGAPCLGRLLPSELEEVVKESFDTGLFCHLGDLIGHSADLAFVDLGIMRRLELARRAVEARNGMLYGQFHEIANRFEHENIAILVVRQACLAATVYNHAGVSQVDTIDVLVRGSDLERAMALMRALEYESPGTPRTGKESGWYLPAVGTMRTFPVIVRSDPFGPGAFPGMTEGLWEQAVTLKVGGCRVYVPSAAGLLLDLCVQACYEHGLRTKGGVVSALRDLHDIWATAIHYHGALNFEYMCRCAKQWRVRRHVHVCLTLVNELFGDAVPCEQLERLKPIGFDPRVMEWAKKEALDGGGREQPDTGEYAAMMGMRNVRNKVAYAFRHIIFRPRQLRISVKITTCFGFNLPPRRSAATLVV